MLKHQNINQCMKKIKNKTTKNIVVVLFDTTRFTFRT
jgi:hypothetical protein